MNKKILIVIVVVVLLGGGVFVWQYLKMLNMEETIETRVYFSNSLKEIEAGYPEIRCEIVYPVIRVIPKTEAIIEATISELLKGPTEEEKNQGYLSNIPDIEEVERYSFYQYTYHGWAGWLTCDGEEMPFRKGQVVLLSLNISNTTAFADFSGEIHAYGGGSCRVDAIRSQITNTLKQFPGIEEVIISVDGERECILQP